MRNSFYDWLVSPSGAAIGTWAASIAAIVALGIAVTALLNDRKRAREDRDRERQRDRKHLKEFIAAAVEVVQAGREEMAVLREIAAARPPGTSGSAIGSEVNKFKGNLDAIIDAIDGLRLAVPRDAQLAMALSRAVTCARQTHAVQWVFITTSDMAWRLARAIEELDRDIEMIESRIPTGTN